MRNRLNVTWHGKRTTARFPEYLWDLAILATGLSDDDLVPSVRSWASHHDNDSFYRHYTASEFVIDFLVGEIEMVLDPPLFLHYSPAGFNPGNSRARCPDTCDMLEAAEAKPTTD